MTSLFNAIGRLRHATVACLVLCAPVLLPGCAFVDKARAGSDLVVAVSDHLALDALAQAEIERKRLRAARCHSPLLTPATISAASIDGRLGPAWIDELMRDCPGFSAFMSDLVFRRARNAGLLLPPALAPGAAASESEPLDFLRPLENHEAPKQD